MASNRGVVYTAPGKVEVQGIDYPKSLNLLGRTANHDVILWDNIRIAEIVGVKVIALDVAPQSYARFDTGASTKFVIDPHGLLS